jgi:hypothetical protein
VALNFPASGICAKFCAGLALGFLSVNFIGNLLLGVPGFKQVTKWASVALLSHSNFISLRVDSVAFWETVTVSRNMRNIVRLIFESSSKQFVKNRGSDAS